MPFFCTLHLEDNKICALTAIGLDIVISFAMPPSLFCRPLFENDIVVAAANFVVWCHFLDNQKK